MFYSYTVNVFHAANATFLTFINFIFLRPATAGKRRDVTKIFNILNWLPTNRRRQNAKKYFQKLPAKVQKSLSNSDFSEIDRLKKVTSNFKAQKFVFFILQDLVLKLNIFEQNGVVLILLLSLPSLEKFNTISHRMDTWTVIIRIIRLFSKISCILTFYSNTGIRSGIRIHQNKYLISG